MSETLYYKCADCHLFADVNPSHEDDPDLYAPWEHLYGECEDCVRTAESHEAKPDVELGGHPLSYWREHGPLLMRVRFEEGVMLPSQGADANRVLWQVREAAADNGDAEETITLTLEYLEDAFGRTASNDEYYSSAERLHARKVLNRWLDIFGVSA